MALYNSSLAADATLWVKWPDGTKKIFRNDDPNLPIAVQEATAAQTTYKQQQQMATATAQAAKLMQANAPEMAPLPSAPSVADATAQSLDAYLANKDKIAAVTSDANTTAQNAAMDALESALPGFKSLMAGYMSKIQSDLNSETTLPADMQANLSKLAAEKGISRGTSGGFNNFSLVKDFGVNLIDYQNQVRSRGLSTLSAIQSAIPQINPLSPTAFITSPTTALAAKTASDANNTDATQSYLNAVSEVNQYNKSLFATSLLTQAGLGATTK